MTPIQQLMLGVGAKKKTYMDDVFATTLYVGNESSKTITTGIDLTTDGGMVWGKSRGGAHAPFLYDTLRGVEKYLRSDVSAGEVTLSTGLTAFSTTGFSVGSHVGMNDDVKNAAWSFKKTPGFFDVVTYNGSSSAQNISHSLGCVPGMIMVKKTSGSDAWAVYHRSTTYNQWLRLNTTNASENNDVWNNTAPTASVFSVGANGVVNESGATYVAYVFAGGESTAATARSVDFDGTGDYLSLAASSDFAFGTGDFTVECWVKPNTITQSGVFQISADTGGLSTGGIAAALGGDSRWKLGYGNLTQLSGGSAAKGQWHHLAYVRHSGVSKLYINGTEEISVNDTTNYTYQNLVIGGYYSSSYLIDAEISNLRVVKGTAVYTSSFRPPTEPLTNITNTKLLCCNNSSTTGSTVTPGTITANGNPTASTDSPFDDPAGFVFGDAEESVIKCGSYVGNGSSDGPEIFLGWEPSYILLKNSDNSDEHWKVFDIMRGIVTGGNEPLLEPSTVNQDNSGNNALDLTPTGFKITLNGDFCNKDGDTIIYVAIRRPDGYVGKPAEAGTDVFNIGAGQNSEPGFIAGFPVDWAMGRDPDTGGAMYTGARLQGEYALGTHDNSAEFATTSRVFDYNNGWNVSRGANSPQISWMWKRHAGFDVVTVISAATGDRLPHSLGRTPEMIWGKNRDNGGAWSVYHKGLNGGTNPEQYRLILSDTDAEAANTGSWNDVAPTATHFTGGANWAGQNPIFMLFASVDGISKVGSFDGQNSDLTVTFGFQPRFLMVKRADSAGDWNVYDTTRGLVSGADKELRLNDTSTQSDHEVGDITSTGFTFACGGSHDTCSAGGKWIYYAHA